MFAPAPRIQIAPLFDGHACVVVDNALQDPEAWVRWSIAQQANLTPSGHAYPGVELWLPPEPTQQLAEFFLQHVRTRLGMRRIVNAACRMSLVTLPPQALAPRQQLCHRDNRGIPEGEAMVASVLYLFKDEALGGTSFYRPRRSMPEIEALVQDSVALDRAAFAVRHPEVAPGYMVEGNDWYERVATVPARFNRAIFYDGGLFHSGDIRHPARMTADPASGRLTFNGFIRCTRKAA